MTHIIHLCYPYIQSVNLKCLGIIYIDITVKFEITGQFIELADLLILIVDDRDKAAVVPPVDEFLWRSDPICVSLFDGRLLRFGDFAVVADVIVGRQCFLVGERMKISGVIFRKEFTPPIMYISVNEGVICCVCIIGLILS